MITINLLPIGTFREKYKGRVFLAAYGICLAIALIGLISVKVNVLDEKLETLTIEQKWLQDRFNTLKRQVEAADKKTKQTYRQWQQLVAIVELEERRRDQTRLLVEVEKMVPTDSSWLLSLEHKNGVMLLEGLSKDKEVVSQLLTRLEGATYIDRPSVTLMEIAQNVVINNIKLTKFKIRAGTKFPQPDVVTKGLPDFGLPPQDDFKKIISEAAPDLIKDPAQSGKKGL